MIHELGLSGGVTDLVGAVFVTIAAGKIALVCEVKYYALQRKPRLWDPRSFGVVSAERYNL
jgi:hypothetical protein